MQFLVISVEDSWEYFTRSQKWRRTFSSRISVLREAVKES